VTEDDKPVGSSRRKIKRSSPSNTLRKEGGEESGGAREDEKTNGCERNEGKTNIDSDGHTRRVGALAMLNYD
jgi:hypothetical protein